MKVLAVEDDIPDQVRVAVKFLDVYPRHPGKVNPAYNFLLKEVGNAYVNMSVTSRVYTKWIRIWRRVTRMNQ